MKIYECCGNKLCNADFVDFKDLKSIVKGDILQQSSKTRWSALKCAALFDALALFPLKQEIRVGHIEWLLTFLKQSVAGVDTRLSRF